MTDTTDRLALPLLIAGQAQKELFHNEALTLVDLSLQAAVAAVGIDAPPASPAPGQCWIVGPAPVGDWAGHAHALAGWTAGGWRFVAGLPGMTVWDVASGQPARFEGGEWVVGRLSGSSVTVDGVQVVGARRGAIAAPAGGAIVDGEARGAIAAILAALAAHGLIAG